MAANSDSNNQQKAIFGRKMTRGVTLKSGAAASASAAAAYVYKQ